MVLGYPDVPNVTLATMVMGKVCVSSVEKGHMEAVTWWSQLHPTRLIPGGDEGQVVAGQEGSQETP